MESVGSNSPSPSTSPSPSPFPSTSPSPSPSPSTTPSPPPEPSSPPRRRRHYLNHSIPSQQLSDRIARALTHQLLLLHRSNPSFFVLGATGNVYHVALSPTPSCSCPDRAAVPCKHVLFVLIRVLGLQLDDPCLRRRTLRPCHLRRLLCSPTLGGSLAGARVRERFHQVWGRREVGEVVVEAGGTCPVCLEQIEGGGRGSGQGVVRCSTCGNWIHQECWARWKRSRGRRGATCVMCRAKWREQERYVNLAAYCVEENGVGGGNPGGRCVAG